MAVAVFGGMTHPPRTALIRKLSVVLFAGALLFAGNASAQDSIFGFPVPRVESGPNSSVTITIAPGVLPPITVPSPRLPRINQPPAARPPAPTPWVSPAAPAARPPAPTPWVSPAAPTQPAPPPFAVPNPAPAPTDGTATAPTLGQAGGRIYGVFVGISDYSGSNDLPFCADDAERVQRAFLNAGLLQAQDSVVLTDGAATRSNVANALERFNRMAGPNDTLVFFFSGHGNQVPDQDGDEADGTDETIVLTDGSLTDDDLRNILQPGPARDFVALDSCYSGGFARDLARLQNSVGFYASREDQLSYVASEFQAGGYLSYYLAQNVTRMGGRAIPMWELQRDLHADFEESGASPQQELTVGVSRNVNTRTVLFDAPSDTQVYVAQR